MKNLEELTNNIKDLKSKINSIDESNCQMSVYAFFNVYEKETNNFNYPSYRINLTTKDIKEYITTLLNKGSAVISKSSEIKPFSYNNNKTTIDFINLDNATSDVSKIKNCLSKIKIANTISLSDAKKKCNCIMICFKSQEDELYFFAKGVPFVKSKQFIFELDENANAKSVKYDLKFPLSLSACIFNNEVYLFANLVESVFGFENSLKEQMSDAMNDVKNADIFDSESLTMLETYSKKGKNYYCYSNFDKNKLDSLKTDNKYVTEFLTKYLISKNSQGKLVLDCEEKQEIMCKFLCNDLKRDYINIDQVYDAPGNDIID